MMNYEIQILPPDGAAPIATSSAPGGYISDEEFWRHATLQIAAHAKGSRSSVRPCEVHMRVFSREVEWMYDLHRLQQVMESARNSCWGATMYLTICGALATDNAQQDVLASLLDAAWSGGVADVLEVDPDGSAASVRQAVGRSRERLKVCMQLARIHEWRLLVPRTRQDWIELFGRLVYTHVGVPQAGPWGAAVLLHRRAQERVAYQAPHILARQPDQTLFVSIDGAMQEAVPPTVLLAQCRGPLETRFLLQRLSCGEERIVDDGVTGVDVSVAVPLRHGDLVFDPKLDGSDPYIVITSGFDPDGDHEDQLQTVLAAREIGGLLELLPRGTRRLVLPSARAGELRTAVQSLGQSALVWVHLAHGQRGRGLDQASQTFAPSSQWLEAFRGRRRNLLLAMFAACESCEVAKAFAASGATVAIGFDGAVPSSMSMQLTTPLLRAAALNGGREAILRAAGVGVNNLRANGCEIQPYAYYGS